MYKKRATVVRQAYSYKTSNLKQFKMFLNYFYFFVLHQNKDK